MILSFALLGRFTARKLGQPSVLGELLMGVLIGNVFYHMGYELMAVLREGTACLDIARLALAGDSWQQAAHSLLGAQAGEEFLRVLRRPNGGEYVQVAQAVDIFSRYGVIFLLFHVGLDTCVAALRRVGLDSLRVAVIGVLAPFVFGFLVAKLLTPEASQAQHLFLAATLGATSIGITARVLRDLR
jgi:Kef-type K+ transport system membrane component KefB